MLTSYTLAQIFAAISFLFGIASFQWKSRTTLLLLWFACALFNGIHFIIVDRPGAAAIIFVSGIRFLIATYTTNKKVMYLFALISTITFFATYKHYLGFIALGSSLLSTYGTFQEKDQSIRIVYLISGIGWVVHNGLADAPVAALMEFTFLLSNIIAYIRFYSGSNRA